MNKVDHKEKVKTVLLDTSKFQKVECNIFKKILAEEDHINHFVRKTFDGVDENGRHCRTYKELLVSGSSLGILYGLPKIHKEDAPIRLHVTRFQFSKVFGSYNLPSYQK